MLYCLLSDQEIQCDSADPFVKEFYENCFKITLMIVKNNPKSQITLVTCPEIDGSGYELLVSVLIRINGVDNWVDYDLWRTEQTVFEHTFDGETLSLGLSLDVHEVLAPRDLRTGGGFRNVRILSSNREYFVSPAALNNLGGSLFKDWYHRECKGESTIVVTELSEEELDVLLTASCAYSTVIVSRQNFPILIGVAWRYKIRDILRAVEQYLLNAKSIHIIKKLDYSYKYKFTILCAYVLKNVGNKYQRKDLLLDYLEKNNIPYCPHYLMEILEVSTFT